MVSAMKGAGLEVPVFKDQEIIDLIAYLRSNGQRQDRRRFQSPGDPGRGAVLFRTKGCQRCHEVFGEDEELGPDLGRAELRGSVTQIAARMWNHWTVMANAMLALDMQVPQFDEGDLADLFSYIFILRYDGLEGDATAGEQVYLDKRCSTCHGRQGEGDVGPPLAQSTILEQKEDFMQRMWNHAPGMQEMMQENKISWPHFEGDDLTDLFAFLASDKAEENGR
jgi:mono/diheme cytochrome c family protein